MARKAKKPLKEQLEETYKAMMEAQNAYNLKLAEFNEQEEKAQTRRSIERGKQTEAALPELATLTKAQFDTYMKKVMLTDYARLALMEICEENEPLSTGQSNGTAAPTPAQATPQGNTPPTPKPAGLHHNGGGNTGQQS